MTQEPVSTRPDNDDVAFDYDSLVQWLPQVPPHIFIDVVHQVEPDRGVHATFLVAGADSRLATLQSGKRVLPWGVAVEPLLQAALLGRTLGQAKEVAHNSAFLLKRFKGRCFRLAEAGERIDFDVKTRWIRSGAGHTAVVATGSFGPLMEIPSVVWFQIDRRLETRPWKNTRVSPMAKDPLCGTRPVMDFTAIQDNLQVREAQAVHVDAVLDLQPGKQIRTLRRVASGLSQMRAHYPGMAIMPGAYQVEAAWQSICLLHGRPLMGPSMEHPAEFSMDYDQPCLPGETLLITATLDDPDNVTAKLSSERGSVATIKISGIADIFGDST